jgi:hypothetical protein
MTIASGAGERECGVMVREPNESPTAYGSCGWGTYRAYRVVAARQKKFQKK